MGDVELDSKFFGFIGEFLAFDTTLSFNAQLHICLCFLWLRPQGEGLVRYCIPTVSASEAPTKTFNFSSMLGEVNGPSITLYGIGLTQMLHMTIKGVREVTIGFRFTFPAGAEAEIIISSSRSRKSITFFHPRKPGEASFIMLPGSMNSISIECFELILIHIPLLVLLESNVLNHWLQTYFRSFE